MHVGEKLKMIRYMLSGFSKGFENLSPVTRRMMGIAVLTELLQVNRELEELLLRLDSEISVEDADIDFNVWLEDSEWMEGKGVFACKTCGKVFKPNVISDDLAGSLSTLIEKPNRSSLKRYIDNGTANPRAKLHIKTEEAIKEYLQPKTDNHLG